MNYTVTYPNGGTNKMWEPLNMAINLGIATKISIYAQTCTRDGCRLILLDENQDEISNYTYDYHQNLGYHYSMAKDMARDINILFELSGLQKLFRQLI